mmetsp:Transcript_5044/g.11505  ORF Transcript_5044/g.11505 Transcript_5044/m.11505 type:complete len:284 (-) Transcript_5044:1425-2276(-)
MKRPLKRGRRSAFALRITYRTFFENARRRRFCRYLSMRSWRVGSERSGASPPCCCCVAVLAVVRVEGIMCTVWPTPNSAVHTLQSELLLFVSLPPKTATSNSPSCPFPVFPAAVAHLFLHSRSTASRFSTRSNFGLAVLLTTSRTSVASNVPYTRGGGGGGGDQEACCAHPPVQRRATDCVQGSHVRRAIRARILVRVQHQGVPQAPGGLPGGRDGVRRQGWTRPVRPRCQGVRRNQAGICHRMGIAGTGAGEKPPRHVLGGWHGHQGGHRTARGIHELRRGG